MSDVERWIDARPRDLGGFEVGRVLPTVGRRFVGPFVLLDHMLPGEHAALAVRPHPHLHLATVTYLLEGEIMHRDSLGSQQLIQPGAINWMSAGTGIVHSERTPPHPTTPRHHGLQLWVGLPRAYEDSEPTFKHHSATTLPVIEGDGVRARVLVGEAFGAKSPVEIHWPMFYADVELEPGARLELPAGIRERAVYVIEGALSAGDDRLTPRRMAVFKHDAAPLIRADERARVILIGGDPLDGPRYIWWNFVSSSRERIIEAAHAWRAGQFPKIPGDDVEFIPAPDEDPHFARAYHQPSDEQLATWLGEAKTIAMVGASSNPERESHKIMKHLLRAGFRVIPVNPNESEVLGQKAVASLAAIGEPVDIVDVFRRSEETPAIADDAIKIGAKTLWLQLGVANDDAAARALAAGMNVVMDICIGATQARLKIAPKQ